jgi:hypothetical protein
MRMIDLHKVTLYSVALIALLIAVMAYLHL